MRKYVENTARLWRTFQAGHPEEAEQLRGFVLGVSSNMSSSGRKKQIESMLASNEFRRLRALAVQHKSELGIREDTDAEFALWIRTICFCDITKSRHST